MEAIGKFFSTIIILTLSTLYGGFVLSKLWGWIITPIYGFRPITLNEAIATSVFIGFIFLGATLGKKDEEVDELVPYLVGRFILITLVYSMYLLAGWIVSCLV